MSMNRTRVAATLAAAATVAGVAMPAAAASAAVKPTKPGIVPDINRVTCGSRTDWLRIFNYDFTGELCFANNGYESVKIYRLDWVDTGNNWAYFVIDDAGYYYGLSLPQTYDSWTFSPYNTQEMTYISIYGR